MKQKLTLQKSFTTAALALALGGSVTISSAATQIVLDRFDSESELGNWGPNGSTLTLDSSQDAGGSSSVGCMKVQYPAGSNGWGTQPQRNLGGQAFDDAQYWSVSFDIKMDPTSSLGGDTVNAPYGHVQIIPVDSSWSWGAGIGWTALTDDYTNWHHVEIGFTRPYTNLNALVVQVGDGGFSSDVIFYLDNVIVNPIPPTYFVDQFTTEAEVPPWAWANWSAPGTNEWVSTPDAGGATPTGSLKLTCNFADIPTNYQQCVFQKNFSFDPSRFTYLDFDFKLDPSSYPMFNGNTFGYLEMIVQGMPGYFWASLGGQNVTLANTNWTHLSLPIAGHGLTNAAAFILKLGGGWDLDGLTNTVTLYIDNIKLWSPQAPPTITSLTRSGPAGLQITSTDPTDEWQRQNIVTPAANLVYSWYNFSEPVTYSFTLANFPDPIARPGYEAHIYFVNYDTCPNANWNETYPAIDWNAADLVAVRLRNADAGGVDFSFNWKTNLPGANVNNQEATVHGDVALGTWSVSFLNNTNVTLSGPGGVSTNFNLAPEVASRFNAQVYLAFGLFKNGFTNNGASATFSSVKAAGGSGAFEDTFPSGLNLDPNVSPSWQLAADSTGILWVPNGTGWWLSWTIPDTGFTAESSANITGPWANAGIVHINQGPTFNMGAIPTASLPAGPSAFFRLSKPNP